MQPVITETLEVSVRAFEDMSDVICVNFRYVQSDSDYARIAELIRKLPSVTSIRVPDSHRLHAIQRDTPLFINDWRHSNKVETFLHVNQSQLERNRRTHVFINTEASIISIGPTRLELWRGSKIAVSFFGPPSGNLVLKLTHSSQFANVTLVLKESHESRTFQYAIPSSLIVTTITLFPSPSDQPSFVPNTRNSLIIEVAQGSHWGYMIQDIRLQDEAGNDYNAASHAMFE
jgi:hypothetical protein